MKGRKILGIIVIIFGVIMVGGSLGYEGPYKIMAPISMLLIVVIGFLIIYWDKVKSWLAK